MGASCGSQQAHVEAGNDVGLVGAVLLGLGVDGPLQIMYQLERGAFGHQPARCMHSRGTCSIRC